MGKKKTSKAAPDIDELEDEESTQPQETLTEDKPAAVRKPGGKGKKGKGKKGKGRDWESDEDERPKVVAEEEEEVAPAKPKQSKASAAAASFDLLDEDDKDLPAESTQVGSEAASAVGCSTDAATISHFLAKPVHEVHGMGQADKDPYMQEPGLIIAEIISIERLPKSEKLKKCKISTGEGTIQVCTILLAVPDCTCIALSCLQVVSLLTIGFTYRW